MIAAACFLPHPPLLLVEYASAADPGAELRARCWAALADLARLGPHRLVVLSGAPRSQPGLDTRAPLGFRVAHELLAAVELPAPTLITVPFDAGAEEVGRAARQVEEAVGAARAGVLVMGDGSARRGEKAPGHLDERAFAVDDAVAAAIAAGDPEPLRTLDPVLTAELLVAGRAAWQVLAAVAPGPAAVRLAHAEDPFGVRYHLGLWVWEHR